MKRVHGHAVPLTATEGWFHESVLIDEHVQNPVQKAVPLQTETHLHFALQAAV